MFYSYNFEFTIPPKNNWNNNKKHVNRVITEDCLAPKENIWHFLLFAAASYQTSASYIFLTTIAFFLNLQEVST